MVEDAIAVRNMLEDFLSLYGYDVLVASHPDTAFKRMKQSAASLDAMILDIGLDDNRSGIEVLELMRLDDRFVDLPVVVLTGSQPDRRGRREHPPQPRAPPLQEGRLREGLQSARRNHGADLREAARSSKSARRPVKSGLCTQPSFSPSPPFSRFPACRRTAPQETESEPAIPVIVEPVRLGTIRASISATGVVSTLPGAAFAVVATQPARIAEITKNVGDAVKSGEMLVRFEFPSLRAQTAVNEAAMKAADLRVQQAQLAQGRIRMLVDKGAASRSELDDADRELTAAEAELAVAKAALGAFTRRAATRSSARRSTGRSPSGCTTPATPSAPTRAIPFCGSSIPSRCR